MMEHLQTPHYAIDPLLPYLPADRVIWESAAGEGQIISKLTAHGYTVTGSDILTGQDFFTWQPETWDIQVTMPASKIRFKWMARSYELGKPFALIMPVDILGTKSAQILFQEWGVGVILLNRRINFKTPRKGYGGSAQFATAWFTWRLGVIGNEPSLSRSGEPISFIFGKINRYPDGQTLLGVHQ